MPGPDGDYHYRGGTGLGHHFRSGAGGTLLVFGDVVVSTGVYWGGVIIAGAGQVISLLGLD